MIPVIPGVNDASGDVFGHEDGADRSSSSPSLL